MHAARAPMHVCCSNPPHLVDGDTERRGHVQTHVQLRGDAQALGTVLKALVHYKHL